MVKSYILLLAFFVSGATLLRAAAPQDTLADLNAMLGGIKSIQLSAGKELPKGFSITPEGWVLKDTAAQEAKMYVFEVVALTPEEDTYNVAFKYDNRTALPKVTVLADKIEMAVGLRKDGMIWVVVAVSMTVFSILIGYLVLLDRKLRKMERTV